MSRIGKQTIEVPSGTDVSLNDGVFVAKGPKGELARKFGQEVSINIDGNNITLSPKKEDGLAKALWGTYASHIQNMIKGVNEPYVKKLVIEGVGFRAELKGQSLVLNVGFSHPVEMEIPEGLDVAVEKDMITVSGIDKEKVGQFIAEVRSKKKPEPYKGKGIRYEDEIVRRKEGKKTV